MSCKKFLLLSRIKQLIYMNLSRCADISIKRWEMWIISHDEKISLMMLNEKKLLSSLTRIRSIKIKISRVLDLDLKSSNQTFERLLNHQKIKWISSIVTIVKNSIISRVIVVNSERWTQTISYEKWTYMKEMTHRVKRIISRLSRKKNNLCYNRCRNKWDENSENRSL
jgi:hypothetical protein